MKITGRKLMYLENVIVSARLMIAMMLALTLSACVTTTMPPAKPVKRVPVAVIQPATKPPVPVPAQTAPPAAMVAQLDEIWRGFPGKTGIAIRRIDGGGEWTVGKRLTDWFPQQSVSKLLVAMVVLDQVDQGKITLDQPVTIRREDLTLFNQPIRNRVVVDGEATEPVRVLMDIAITDSDCTANDALLRLVGGPEAIRAFITKNNLGNLRFGEGERKMQSSIAGLAWRQEYSIGNNFFSARSAVPFAQRKVAMDRYLADPYDGATPDALVSALARLAKGELLSPKSTRVLLDVMGRVNSGPNRLKAGLPAGWRLVHKTGTGQILAPIATGYNDVGIATAPDGTRYAVAVMIANTTAGVPQRMEMMQAVTRSLALYHAK